MIFIFMLGSKNNNNLQFDIIVNNEIIVLQSFIEFFGMACILYFKFFWQFHSENIPNKKN